MVNYSPAKKIKEGNKDVFEVLNEYGNMSSPTILFVLKRIQQALDKKQPNNIFGAAFGPGLTIETFILST